MYNLTITCFLVVNYCYQFLLNKKKIPEIYTHVSCVSFDLNFLPELPNKTFAQLPFFWNVLYFFVVLLSLYITMYLWYRHVLSMPDLSSICAHSTFVFSISISSIIIKHIWNLQFTVYSHEIKVEQTICHTYIYYLSVFVFYLVSLVLSSLFSWAGKMHVVLF